MNKENSRGAAGLRRSAIAERIRLREEWSELKGTDVPTTSRQNVLTKKRMNPRCTPSASGRKWGQKTVTSIHKEHAKPHASSEALHGVVALVEVGDEARALPLRAALAALGASVAGGWSPLVTHLVWWLPVDPRQGPPPRLPAGVAAVAGGVRGRPPPAPLWPAACAAARRRRPERAFPAFPAASRHSDLPSPRTLRTLLKRAEMQNIPLVDLLSDSKEEGDAKPRPLRISTETEHDTSETSADTSNDTIDIGSRVNTAPRRALPNTSITPPPSKSRRKLFTQKEAELAAKSSGDESDTVKVPTQKRVRIQHNKLTQREKKDLARAERMAKRILASCTTQETKTTATQSNLQFRIVLTGMSRTERQTVTKAIHELNGRIQNHVTKRTTHVLLGSCRNDTTTVTNIDTDTCFKVKTISSKSKQTTNDISGVNRLGLSNRNLPNITGITYCDLTTSDSSQSCYVNNRNGDLQRNNENNGLLIDNGLDKKARTLNALQGAARGCRVLHARWAIESAISKKWLHHNGYEVHHLRKICQKARIERTALGRTHSDYAYDVFNGMRIRITSDAEQKDAATQLLKLCGAVVHEQDGGCTQNGGRTQDGGRAQDGGRTQDGARTQNGVNSDCDIIIGVGVGQVSSKWVFDCVAAARMRTTRRYINSSNLAQRDR